MINKTNNNDIDNNESENNIENTNTEMKKIIILSDIHGNLSGLKSIMKEISTYKNITHIVAAGDLFGEGSGLNDLMSLMISHNFIMLYGNHDEYIFDKESVDTVPMIYRPFVIETNNWIKKNMKPEYLDILCNLPASTSIKLNDKNSLRVFHYIKGSPVNCNSNVPINELINEYEQFEENIIAYGHSHEKHVMQIPGKLLINVGYIGRRADGKSDFTVVEYNDEIVVVKQNVAIYDQELEEKMVLENKVPVFKEN